MDRIDRLYKKDNIDKELLLQFLKEEDVTFNRSLYECAKKIRENVFGKTIYVRGLIEFSSYCKNDCFYCGIRNSNICNNRYRLSKEEILDCAKQGYEAGFRTFVLQSGEDECYSDDMICDIVNKLHELYPDCAITLSIGERNKEAYQRYYDAGASRYLLRHESASEELYHKIHPPQMSLKKRKYCLSNLKEIGYQTGSGMMIGVPFQKIEDIAEDILYLYELQPEMIGIGPFIHHQDTPFNKFENGSVELTLKVLAILRILFPYVLLPATTSLTTLDKNAQEKAICIGANVIMPNISPLRVRKLYMLYDNKAFSGNEAMEGFNKLKKEWYEKGYTILVDKGDYTGGVKNV